MIGFGSYLVAPDRNIRVMPRWMRLQCILDKGSRAFCHHRWFYLPNSRMHTLVPPAMAHEMPTTPCLQRFENGSASSVAASRRLLMLDPEQKRLRGLIDLVGKLSEPGELMVNFFARQMAVTRHVCFFWSLALCGIWNEWSLVQKSYIRLSYGICVTRLVAHRHQLPRSLSKLFPVLIGLSLIWLLMTRFATLHGYY